MYTQCPECEAAFRVTADVLKVAAGMVRCGSCSHAFNSLSFLSEEKPRPKKPEIQLPELLPEPDDEPEDERPAEDAPAPQAAAEPDRPASRPQSISAEQSAALLKTLDQLAGEDIRIEDTGVEWRVLDDDDTSDDGDDEAESDLLSDPEVTNAFFVGDIERYSEAAREDARAAEGILVETTDDIDEDLSDDAHNETHVDMDADVAEVFAGNAETDNEPYAQTGVINAGEFNPLQTHVDEILHDSETPIHELVAPSASDATPTQQAPEDVLRFDDNTPLPDDFLDEDDAAEQEVSLHEPSIDDSQSFDASMTLGNPDDWQQLLNDFDDLLAGSETAEERSSDDQSLTDFSIAEDDPEQPPAEQAPGVMHSDQSSAAADQDQFDDTVASDASGDDWEPLPQVVTPAATQDNTDSAGIADEPDIADTSAEDAHIEPDQPVAETQALDDSWSGDQETEARDEGLDLSQILEPDDEGLVDAGEADPVRDDSDLPGLLNLDDAQTTDADKSATHQETPDEFDIPELSEEEQTINMLIDQDLLSIAREDEDGFTSTIVFEKVADPMSVGSGVLQGGTRLEETVLSEEPDEDAGADDRLLVLDEESASKPAGKQRKFLWLGAAALLVLALGGQAIHQTRDQLATKPAFRSVLAPVYNALGMPLDPDWDVSGWAIERTQGATDGTDQLLTIISEVRNRTAQPMPYPIITVSLTDRSQDPVGSLVVEPKDYLADARAGDNMVAGGVQFQARIPVDAPPGDASGYTINACYRVAGDTLRCANEDFLR